MCHEGRMPVPIKFVLILLFTSSVIAITGTYLDMELLSDEGIYDPYIYAVDLVWFAIIGWIAWDLGIKRKDIRLTLILVGFVIVGFEVWDFIEYGFSNSNFVYGVEAMTYIAMLLLLNNPISKEWYSNEDA
jgi:hypothetical protein